MYILLLCRQITQLEVGIIIESKPNTTEVEYKVHE